MPEYIKGILCKYREQIVYLMVGGFTTFVSWGVFHILTYVLDSRYVFQLLLNEFLNWAVGVAVAYPLNRKFVFQSKNVRVIEEVKVFVLSRFSTLVLSYLFMWLFVTVFVINQYVSKYLIVSPLVVILNYVFSKFFVFRKNKD